MKNPVLVSCMNYAVILLKTNLSDNSRGMGDSFDVYHGEHLLDRRI